jgi:outer membrane immunogenic protein
MKRILGGIVCLVSLIAANAHAAPPAVYNWNGFYAGLNLGYSWGNSSTTQSFYDSTSGALLGSSGGSFDMTGVIGGGQAGYNWQRANWVYGVEADIQGSAQKGNNTAVCAGGTLAAAPFNGACTPGHVGDTAPFNTAGMPVNFGLNQSLEWFGTVRGRVGMTFTPVILGYVTGGLAYGEVSTSGAVSGTNITGAQGTNVVVLTSAASSFGDHSTRAGWTLGCGVEGLIGANWSARAEYLYIDLGTVSGTALTPVTAPSGAAVAVRYSSHVTDNILRVGFNYRFGGP